jgi:pyruvate/2-oxoglutarate dehydrogenase complex dihydrolipoamide dehydrogenase (E3) component
LFFYICEVVYRRKEESRLLWYIKGRSVGGMGMRKYDIVVIGGGAGGLTVAAGAASLGARVALIEKEGQPGGDCLHFGCVPSKALITAAKAVHTAKKASSEFGLEIKGQPDFLQALQRVQKAIKDIQVHDDADRFRKMGVDVYKGFGRFVDSHHIEISGEERVYGKRIVISTGSSPFIPPIEGLQEAGFLTNETIFNLKVKPNRLVIIGAGPIGLELAQSFARFGTHVTVMEASSRLFTHEDEDIVPYVHQALVKEMTILLKTQIKKVEKIGNGEKRIVFLQGDKEQSILVDDILVATGRRPNTSRIGLETIGVKIDNHYIAVKDTLQTNVPHIYAIGDVVRAYPFTHAAGMEGKLVVGNAVFGLRRKVNYEHVPWVTYTDPEVFHLGLTEKEARMQYGSEIKVYKQKLDDVDRFVADRDKNGIVKVITNKKGIILGAHAVGKDAGDWMQEIVYAKAFGHKLGKISNVIHPYPTHTAAVQRTADQYWREKLFQGILPKVMKKYIQWFR